MVGQIGEAFWCSVPSYLSLSRHGVYYFRWPLPPALHPQRKSVTLKISLQTRDPNDALCRSRIFSYVGQRLTSYGVAYGMTFEEVRRLLSTHFSQPRDLVAPAQGSGARKPFVNSLRLYD